MNTKKKFNVPMPEIDYVENPKDKGQHAIWIKSGKYKGIIYTYGIVGFEEKENEEGLQISFSYDIIENQRKIDVLEDKEFHNTIGDLLTKILQYNASKSNDAGQPRENDNFESGNEQ